MVNTEQTVQSSIGLLQWMSDNPRAVLEVLDPAGRNRVMTELNVLAGRSAEVEAEADLLYVTDALHRLLRETPALAKLLSPRTGEVTPAQERPTTRKVTIEHAREAYGEAYPEEHDKKRYILEHAAQIHNHVVQCRRDLEQALAGYSQRYRR